ncbi:efflux RND transporter periplasmic adaptor subunit [Thiolapillus sp.]
MKKTLISTLVILAVFSGTPALAKGSTDKNILYWVAPMDPSYRRDGPGKSPMGMDLIPVYEDAEAEGSDVRISPAVVQNLGVRTAEVTKGVLSRLIDTVGYIDYDESRVTHIHMRVSGWIERLSVKSEGEAVKKGQRLFSIYSPDLVNAQEEFLRALSGGNQGLVSASRERLKALGISGSEIARLEKRRKVLQTVPVFAPQDGVVSELAVREGMYVKPSLNVMTLADLSSVWLIAEVFERQSDWVSIGDEAEMTLPFLPGKRWQGRVEYIYPSLDPKTRTLMARLRFDNPGEALKPNMYARVKLHAQPREQVLSIPMEALIRSGDKDRVIVALGEGRFNAVEVLTGIESGDRIEIVQGLKAGDRVVTSGQFLLDSEASLKASFSRMSETSTDTNAKSGSDDQAAVAASGQGRIVSLPAGQGMIKLDHRPIPALGWPAMEMMFFLDQGADASAFREGDEVRFQLEKRNGDFYIIALEHADGEGTP